MSILAMLWGSASSRPAGGVSTDSHARYKGVEPMTRDELLQLPPMITVPVAGRILGLKSRSAAYRAAARGDLPTVRMCGKLFVPTELVLQKVGLRAAVHSEPRAAS
jgi:hypothetical protein